MRWCSAEGIAPEEVDQAVIERFGRALCEDSLHRHPLDAWQRTVGGWNRAVDTIARLAAGAARAATAGARGLCAAAGGVPGRRSRPMSRSGSTRLAGKAGLDVGPVRPLRPVTIAKWRFAMRQLASALVLSGRQPATLTSLADLVTPEAAAAILGFFLERAGNRPCAQTQGLAARLKAIAEHHVGVAPAVLAQLQRMARRVTPPAQGMTDKNRATLRQFADPAMQRRLVNLPAVLFARLPTPVCPAQAAGAAPAVGPGGRAPAGGADAAEEPRRARAGPAPAAQRQRPARALVRRDPGRGGQERRGARAAAAGAHRPAAGDLSRPGPAGAGGAGHAVAVPRPARRRSSEVTLGPQIGGFIRRELGCRLSPHQFRHLCGYLYLQRHPHGHEVVRAMLGHRSIETTLTFYAGLEGIAAARHYDAMLQELITPPPRPRRRAMTARLPGGRPAACRSRPGRRRTGWAGSEATAKGDLLLDDGPGAALRPNTLRRHRSSYGRWLAWLAEQGRLDPDLPAGARATPAAVAAYVAELQAHNASGTVLVRAAEPGRGPALVGARAGAALAAAHPGPAGGHGPARARQAQPPAARRRAGARWVAG